MAKDLKKKIVFISPDSHEKLTKLSKKCYRGLSLELSYLINKEYNNAMSCMQQESK